jgi:hypothetical protein
MTSLQIKELPEHIYLELETGAKREKRSLSEQIIIMLERGIRISENPAARRKRLMQHIRENPIVNDGTKLPDPAELIRKDRER